MIIAKIEGGLGNQLFQYAAAKSLAVHHEMELLLDVTAYTNSKERQLGLSYFNIDLKKASEAQIAGFINRTMAGKLRDHFLPARFKKVYKEPFFHFDTDFFNASSNVYLKGYWQSEKYFKRIAQLIRTEFSFKQSVIERTVPFAIEIAAKESVAVHIRRADYKEGIYFDYHGTLEKSYYTNAMKLVAEKINNPVFYFFSDDIDWVKKNFQQDNAVFVSGDISQTTAEDLYLMSQCRHNIIANSSFSWWGAWLNNNPDKIVVAPKNWFNEGPKDTEDIYPDGWIRL